MIFDRLVKALEKLQNESNSIVRKFFIENQKEIKQGIRNQLSQGKRGDGTKLPNYKNNKQNQKRGRAGKPIKLYDKGDFYKSIDTVITNSFVEVVAEKKNGFDLRSKYGDQILWISDDMMNRLRGLFVQQLKQYLKDV